MADDAERHRLQLEDSISRLRASLQHWLTWDADYEALKEEIEAVSDHQDEELRRIHQGYEGDLLRDRELDEIFGLQAPRSRRQIVNILQRRIDYVNQNVGSLRKQLDAQQNEHDAVAEPLESDENAEPITEILEELDDDDNVVSFRLNQASESLPCVRDALNKAGVAGFEDDTRQRVDAPAGQIQPVSTSVPVQTPSSSHTPQPGPAKGASEPPVEMSRRAKRIDDIMKTAREQERISKQDPVIPEDEDVDDAALRRQMIQYGMNDIGAIVAELELEEGDESDFDEEMDDIDDNGEDRYGRSTGRLVSEDYRQRMLELEKKHDVRSRFNQAADDQDQHSDDEGIGRIKVNRQVSPSSSKAPPLKSSIKDKQTEVDPKKGVRFAQSLDVAPDDEPPALSTTDETEESAANPLGDVIERAGPGDTMKPPAPPRASRTQSLFKQARDLTTAVPPGPLDAPRRFINEKAPESPTCPQDTPLADQLVEREPGSTPKPPNDLDDSLSHDAVASQHQRLRKRFIQRQGGFLQEDTSPVQFMNDFHDEPEPISRFKAARLSRS
ncbi:udp-galactose transporter like protein [Ophiocordyceps camponoti-floridani]|uniref:Udp-galactose transporter like protein n=1 Tax=Ophiocordyceps camponoti-floridani TaxID=2030778 RepID=A0A8H4VFG0_9HYPO|nr:udp-galactose transporter like protein [Ophiocordyceps camponoti-floridani]